jgi:hypothetical protein
MYSGEKKLWKAVVMQAMQDATDKKLNRIERRKAINWIRKDSLDFFTVCDLAMLEPTAVRKGLGKKKFS